MLGRFSGKAFLEKLKRKDTPKNRKIVALALVLLVILLPFQNCKSPSGTDPSAKDPSQGGPFNPGDSFPNQSPTPPLTPTPTPNSSPTPSPTPSPVSSNDNDGDGILNAADNCPNVANPGQENIDRINEGDACDPLYKNKVFTILELNN